MENQKYGQLESSVATAANATAMGGALGASGTVLILPLRGTNKTEEGILSPGKLAIWIGMHDVV